MLSIGKLAPAQARYYLDQAEGRVDVVDSVAEGLEEYYVGGTEARGEWIGAACAEFGLEGPVEAAALRSVLAGLNPRDGGGLRGSSTLARIAAFDLTFSAPKSVSVLFGIAEPGTRERVRAAHDRAMREAVGYLERSAAAVRRGHAGVVVEQADGLVAAAFRHRTSRAGDPQLHTHVLVANLGRGLDGRWSALDGRRLYAHARTASFLYQAVLRSELTRTLGVEWTPVHKGIAEVAGIRGPVLRAFSRRRSEIESALAERGMSGARAAEAAALSTRRAKDARVRPEALVGEWRARAAELGFGRPELERIVGRARAAAIAPNTERSLARALGSPGGLTAKAASFNRDDVLQAICESLPAGTQVDAATVERLADRFLGSDGVVPLLAADDEAAGGQTFRRRHGRVVPLALERLRYSTTAQLTLEQLLVNRIVGSQAASSVRASRDQVEAAVAARPLLSGEQRHAIERLCLEADGVAVLIGKAGSGKTYALGAAREAWQAAGHPVLGVATARRAARELQEGAGIPSTSTAALLGELRSHDRAALPASCVLVVDEAGMVSTRDLSDLLDRVERAGGKLVLVGDHRQLPELRAGGTLRGLAARGLAIELTENVRQQHSWERAALDQLRDGRADAALELYQRHGRIRIEQTGDQARERLVREWADAGDREGAVMIAARRADVADLNARARGRLRSAGEVEPDGLSLPGGEFAVGDRVVIKRNELRLGVSNGDRGQVVAVDPRVGSLTVRRSDQEVELGSEFLHGMTRNGDPTLEHGCAITGHVAQGVTVDHAFVLADGGISREWAYVAMSRGRLSNQLYLSEEVDSGRAEFAPTSPPSSTAIDRLAARLATSDAQLLAIDTGRPVDTAEAECRLADAQLERHALERGASRWLPGGRQRLEDAREREAAARDALSQARRRMAEVRHAASPVETPKELEQRRESLHERLAERAHDRVLDRGRELGRER